MLKSIRLFPIALSLLLPLFATARTSSSNWESVRAITPRTEVRILSSNAQPIRGTLDSTTDISVIMTTGAQSISRPQIVSVSVKKRGHRVRNAFIGLGAGLAAGIGLSLATASRCNGEICGIAAAGRVIAGGGLGLIGGTVAGIAWPTGGWREVYRQ